MEIVLRNHSPMYARFVIRIHFFSFENKLKSLLILIPIQLSNANVFCGVFSPSSSSLRVLISQRSISGSVLSAGYRRPLMPGLGCRQLSVISDRLCHKRGRAPENQR